jgi:hypothetical protein
MSKRLPLRPVLLASALVFAFAGTALANPHRMHGDADGVRQKLDSDGDGQVALAEVEANAVQRATEIDANGDGRITADEVRAHREKARQSHAEKRLARFDANGDGAVSVEEFATAQSERIAKLDRDGDGVISGDEFHPRRHGPRRHRAASDAGE